MTQIFCLFFFSPLTVIEGETALTLTVVRGNESTFVTRPDLLTSTAPFVSMETVEQLRNDLEQRLATWCGGNQPDDQAGQETWRQLEMVTSGLAQDLCESLRLILEPSQASRLKVTSLPLLSLFMIIINIFISNRAITERASGSTCAK